jgi:hypothetical protein
MRPRRLAGRTLKEVTMRSVIRSTGLTVLLAAGLLAGACSDDDNPSTPTPSPTPTPAPEPTPTPAPSPTPTPDATSQEVSFLGKLRVVDPVDQTLTVASGTEVVIRPDTQILRDGQPITLGDLVIGETLRVNGLQSEDSVVASRIIADPYNDQ